MTTYFSRAVKDILKNGYLNAVAVVTIALSVLIVSSFGLLVLNANDLIAAWKKGIRIMAYLDSGISNQALVELESRIRELRGVQDVDFISKEAALEFMKEQMKGQDALLENIDDNPLPDAFEISLSAELSRVSDIEILADRIGRISSVADVEFGRLWLRRFANIFSLFRMAAFGIGMLFFGASVFIIGNTIRLVLYSRQEEIEIMRYIGATERFIKTPFYIEGVILGALGGCIGMAAAFIGYTIVSSNMAHGIASEIFSVRFYPLNISMGILFCSILVGWLGCFLSLKQFLKEY
ncbi:MAG: permease-like cell division protein FtsX [Desulfobacterales bacterium]